MPATTESLLHSSKVDISWLLASYYDQMPWRLVAGVPDTEKHPISKLIFRALYASYYDQTPVSCHSKVDFPVHGMPATMTKSQSYSSWFSVPGIPATMTKIQYHTILKLIFSPWITSY